MGDRAEAAQTGITEHLLAAENPPDASELIATGWKAMKAQYRRDLHAHGINSRDHTRPSAAFGAYWWSTASTTHSPEDAVVDRLAFWQIWDTLTPLSRDTVRAVAEHATPAKAAAELGVAYNTFTARLSRARDAFRELWHEGEDVPPRWGYDWPGARISPQRAMYLLRQRKRDQRENDPDRTPPRTCAPPRVQVGVPGAELLARHDSGETQAQLAQEFGVSKYVIYSRITEARRTREQHRRQAG